MVCVDFTEFHCDVDMHAYFNPYWTVTVNLASNSVMHSIIVQCAILLADIGRFPYMHWVGPRNLPRGRPFLSVHF